MSRVAKYPVKIPAGVEVTIKGQEITLKGAKGQQQYNVHNLVKVSQNDDGISFKPANDSKAANALAGTSRANVNNAVIGVSQGFEKKLMLVGVGYRAQAQGNKLNLSLGYSHPILYLVPEGIAIETPSATEVVVKGSDKQKVGQVAAEIRKMRPPEPYKGKGVRYADEVIHLKETKK